MFKPRPYQEEISTQAARKLKKFKIVALSIQTRCGKTIISMLTCQKMNYKNVLFVTKKKAISSIEADYEHFKEFFNLTIINYESVTKIENVNFDCVVCDESHNIGGAYPRPSKRFGDIKPYVVNDLILMSATFSPESYSQLYHQFNLHFLSPWREYKNFYKWAKDYVNVKKKYLYNREVNDYSDANKELIERATKHLFITYTQKEAGFKTEINEHILTCQMKPITKSIIKKLEKDLIVEGKNDSIIADTAVKLQQKVHQLSSGTCIGESGQKILLDDSKAEFIKNYFGYKKIAIFYKFQAEADLIKLHFDNITDSPEVFNLNNHYTFIGQFQSIREGVNLSTAEAIVFYNIDFSYLSYEQSRNRLMSKDRVTPADVYFIFSDCGIEKDIYKKVRNKENYTLSYYKKTHGIKSTKFSQTAV